MVASALRKSKVVKVCKDGWNVKRRLPFRLTKELQAQLNACTVYTERMDTNFEKYGYRFITAKGGYQ
jgi:hypothetical protein